MIIMQVKRVANFSKDDIVHYPIYDTAVMMLFSWNDHAKMYVIMRFSLAHSSDLLKWTNEPLAWKHSFCLISQEKKRVYDYVTVIPQELWHINRQFDLSYPLCSSGDARPLS